MRENNETNLKIKRYSVFSVTCTCCTDNCVIVLSTVALTEHMQTPISHCELSYCPRNKDENRFIQSILIKYNRSSKCTHIHVHCKAVPMYIITS